MKALEKRPLRFWLDLVLGARIEKRYCVIFSLSETLEVANHDAACRMLGQRLSDDLMETFYKAACQWYLPGKGSALHLRNLRLRMILHQVGVMLESLLALLEVLSVVDESAHSIYVLSVEGAAGSGWGVVVGTATIASQCLCGVACRGGQRPG